MNFLKKNWKKKDLAYITESFGVTGGLGAKPRAKRALSRRRIKQAKFKSFGVIGGLEATPPTRGERSEPWVSERFKLAKFRILKNTK